MSRLLCVVWVLGLGSWCFGQAEPWVELCRQTEEVEVDGERMRFALHLCAGFPSPSGESENEATPDRTATGLTVSVVQPGYTGLIWAEEVGKSGGEVGSSHTHALHELWWDGSAKELWVARVETGRQDGSSIVLWRLELDRNEAFSRLELNRLGAASGSTPVSAHSMRFERGDDGVVLILADQEGNERILDLASQAEERASRVLGSLEGVKLSMAVQKEVWKRTAPPQQEPSLTAWRRYVSEAHEVGGESVQFVVHQCYGSGVPVFAKDSDNDARSHFHGHVLSARSEGRVDVLWGSESVVPDYFSAASSGITLAALHWDDTEQQLWVALVGTTNERKSRAVVWSLDLKRDAETGALSVDAIAQTEQEYAHEPTGLMGPLYVDATRFTQEDDGLVLNLYHQDQPKTVIKLRGRMQPSIQSLASTRASKETRAAIREESQSGGPELARSGPHVALHSETEVVELSGLQVRFVMHRLNGAYSDSGMRAGYEQGYTVSIVPADTPDELAPLWHTHSPSAIHIPFGWGFLGERTAMWWDKEQERLWVGAAVTSSKGAQHISVYRIGAEKDTKGTWSISTLDTARGQYSSDERKDPDALSSELLAEPRIKSMRFVRAEDGGVDLWVAYPEGNGTMLDLTRNIREVSGRHRSPRSVSLLELIREDLAEREKARE